MTDPTYRPPKEIAHARAWAISTAAVVFVATLAILFWPPPIGLANQGDYQRITAMFGLHYGPHHVTRASRYDLYWVRNFVMGARGIGHYVSSSALVVAAAWMINFVLHPGRFDAEVVAILFALVFASAFGATAVGLRHFLTVTQTLFALALGFFVFADIAYTAYFPTLYSEPASFVFWLLLLALAWYASARQRTSKTLVTLIWITGVLFIAGKIQNVVLAPVVLLFLFALWRLGYGFATRRAFAIAAALFIVFSWLPYALNPPTFNQQNVYDSVFTGALADGSSIAANMRWFHIDPVFANLSDQPYFSPRSLREQAALTQSGFYRDVGHGTVMRFYLAHPAQLWRAMQESQTAALTEMRPSYLGNYSVTAHMPAGAHARRMDLWSDISARLPANLGLWIAFYVVYGGVCLYSWRRAASRQQVARAVIALFVLACALVQWPVPYLGEGRDELGKHLFIYDAMFDTMIVIAICWIMTRVRRSQQRA